MKYKNVNDVIYAVAQMARELADKPLPILRALAGYGCDTQTEAIRVNSHMKRGELVEHIITEEMVEEFPADVLNEEAAPAPKEKGVGGTTRLTEPKEVPNYVSIIDERRNRSFLAKVTESHPDGSVTATTIGRDGKTFRCVPHPKVPVNKTTGTRRYIIKQ